MRSKTHAAFTLIGILCVSVAILSHADCMGQDTQKPIKPEQLSGLISSLASPEFATRESAMEMLAQSDEALLPDLELALKELSEHELEARVRLSGIVAKLKYERTEIQLRSFVRSTDPKETMGFDGWLSFSRVGGTNRNAKVLFLKLLETYPELVNVEITSKKEALAKARDIAATINESNFSLKGYEVPDALAMLYCLNVADDETDSSLERLSIRTFRTSPFGQFQTDPQWRRCLEKLMSGWAKQIEEERLDCTRLLLEKDYPQAKEIALKLLESKEIQSDPDAFAVAMKAIFRFGNKADLPKVEKWLDDKTVCFEHQAFVPVVVPAPGERFSNQLAQLEVYSYEFRDGALLVAMQLSGEDVSQVFPRFQSHPISGFHDVSITLPIRSDEERAKRIEKWREKRKSLTKT